jgi:uncharacterized membrane protein YgcG
MKIPFLLALFAVSTVHAAEEIRSFASRIEVLPNADLIVTETLRVMPEGNQIKRGIYRDFPTLYVASFGLRTKVPFELLEVLRDGKQEVWHTEERSNGPRIYLGSADVFLPHEETTYTIKYRTGHQLGFFKDFDELYWNVTGNGWSFPILQASASVELPPGANPRSIEAYTGPAGSRGTAYRITSEGGHEAALVTTEPLNPGEGLTIVLTWPKGFVKAPSQAQGLLTLLSANRGSFVGAIGLLLAFVYFMVSWRLVGRDPDSGVIIPLFEPPKGFTPQDVRYLNGLGTCDQTSFAAAVMNLAVRRALTIKPLGKDSYSLVKGSGAKLEPEQARLLAKLFPSGLSLSLVQSNHATLRAAQALLAKDLASKIAPYFFRNTRVWVIGLVAAIIPFAISLLDMDSIGGTIFVMVLLTVCVLGGWAIFLAVVKSWKSPNKLAAIPVTLIFIPFLGACGFGVWMIGHAAPPWVCVFYVVGIILCVVFHHLLKRPTPEGQQLRDRILGFKKYLSVAEAERLDLENPPERTPELFEKFLPYALALGVEQAWSQQFSDVLAAAAREMESGTRERDFVLPVSTSSFTSSFSSAIASASTAPGSSSGSSGGGSSGGGGGGGGGGGW